MACWGDDFHKKSQILKIFVFLLYLIFSCYYCSINCSINRGMFVGKFLFFQRLVLPMHHNWRASRKKFCRLKVLLIQFSPVALSVIFLLVYAKCNLSSELKYPGEYCLVLLLF